MLFFFVDPEKQLLQATLGVSLTSFDDRPLEFQGDNRFILIASKCAITAGITNNVSI
jgi:hypothetical protein